VREKTKVSPEIPNSGGSLLKKQGSFVAILSKALKRERHHMLKLFLALQVTSIVTGAVFASAARLDLLAGVGLGLSIGSLNFGVSLTLSSSEK
jgi:hypothetical protein